MARVEVITEAEAALATRKGKAGERLQNARDKLRGLATGLVLVVTMGEDESTYSWSRAFHDAGKALGVGVAIRQVKSTLYVSRKSEGPIPPPLEQEGDTPGAIRKAGPRVADLGIEEACILGVLPTTTDMGDVILARTKAQLDAAIEEAREEQWPEDRFVYACEKRLGKPPHPHGASGTCLEVA